MLVYLRFYVCHNPIRLTKQQKFVVNISSVTEIIFRSCQFIVNIYYKIEPVVRI